MNVRTLHARVCSLLICLALTFANVAGAIGMASVDHAETESHSSHSMHGSALMDMTSIGGDHSDHADHLKMSTMADSDCCMDDASCIAECAASCTSGALTGNQLLTPSLFGISYVPRAYQAAQSTAISGPYKPPKSLH